MQGCTCRAALTAVCSLVQVRTSAVAARNAGSSVSRIKSWLLGKVAPAARAGGRALAASAQELSGPAP